MPSEDSFWDESETIKDNKKNKSHNRKHEILLVPKTIEQLERTSIKALEQLEYIEILRAEQYKILQNVEEEYSRYNDPTLHPEYKNMMKETGMITYEISTELKDKVLKIKTNFLLPVYKKTKNIKLAYYNTLQDIYQMPLIKLLVQNRKDLPNFSNSDKVFILIVQHFGNNIITDLDNRFHSFIFNALRASLIIPDDNWKNLSYMEDGKKTSGKPYTEIFVGNNENMIDIINLSNKDKK
ncbi:hypothetical protein [Robertmurraya massiliosenegalensis]|uniref:hypothetical protein n=1 Tax=Robertmurraya massiliosenegalensis TaxID=1287657 RepID=UPI0002D8123B|nr:hypothetical protein [Robertmurraya massiliosenegalensis]